MPMLENANIAAVPIVVRTPKLVPSSRPNARTVPAKRIALPTASARPGCLGNSQAPGTYNQLKPGGL